MEAASLSSSIENPADPTPAKQRPSWPMRLALALVCIAGGSMGFFAAKPLYQGEALVQFRRPPRVWGDGSSSSEVDDKFLEAEAAFGRSQRLADRAVLAPPWKPLGNGTSPAAAAAFSRALTVRPEKGGVIRFLFVDADPKTAAAGAGAAVLAFRDARTERRELDDSKRIAVLQQRLEAQYGQARTMDDDLAKAAASSGGVSPAAQKAALAGEILRLDREIWKAQSAAGAPGAAGKGSDPAIERLIHQRDQRQQQAAKSQDQAITLSKLEEERDYLRAQTRQTQERINQLIMDDSMGSALRLLSNAATPTAPAIDHRIRNAAWGALAGLIVFLTVQIGSRKLRKRYRIVTARTAFPVIVADAPKAVLGVEEIPPTTPAMDPETQLK